jgi:SAM-dependent methyltransferase
MSEARPDEAAATAPEEDTPEYREWLAAAYDTDVYEQWIRPFEQALYRDLEVPEKGMVLEVGCATGHGTQQLLRALDGRLRLVAQEDRSFLLDLARARLTDHVGSKLFFNSDHLPKLRYDASVFSLVVANLSWWERPDRPELLAEMIRVLDRGGRVAVTVPVAGTFGEILDLVREVSVKLDLAPAVDPLLARADAVFAPPDDWVNQFEEAGLTAVQFRTEEATLAFGSSRALFSSTVSQARWAPIWKEIFGAEWDRILWHVRQMIDAYWADAPFPLTLRVGVVSARKGTPSEISAAPPAPPPRVAEEGETPAAGAREAAAVPAPEPPRREIASGFDIAEALLGPDVPDAPAAPDALDPPVIAPPLQIRFEPRDEAQTLDSDELEPLPEPLEVEPLAEPEELEPLLDPAQPESYDPYAAEASGSADPYAGIGGTPAAPLDSEPYDPLLDEPEPYRPDEGDLHAVVPGPRDPSGEFEPLSDRPRPSVEPVQPMDLGRPAIEPLVPVDLRAPADGDDDDDDDPFSDGGW